MSPCGQRGFPLLRKLVLQMFCFAVLRRFPRHFPQLKASISTSSSIQAAKYCIMANYEVKHDKEGKMFVIALGKEDAILEYVKEGDKVLNMWHTEVPASHRGHGIAAHLAKAAFDYTVENNLKFRPTCTYLQKYIKEHPLPEYTERTLPPQ